jgi:hypothetical protein
MTPITTCVTELFSSCWIRFGEMCRKSTKVKQRKSTSELRLIGLLTRQAYHLTELLVR